MKMIILKIGYKNIRKIADLTLSFTHEDGSIVKNSFIMMANGTGKTTTIALIKGLLDGSAEDWNRDEVRSFAPTTANVDSGEFSIVVKFDEKQYTYFLTLDYKEGSARIETLSVSLNGREKGRRLPEAIKKLFTKDFVRRFVFDGEQATKSTDSSSNEAEEAIKYLYRLDKLDEIIVYNQQLLENIQNAEGGSTGTSKSLSNLRTRQADVKTKIDQLKKHRDDLQKKVDDAEESKKEKQTQRDEIDKNYEELNQEKQDIERNQIKNKGDINSQTNEILDLIKSPYLVSRKFCERMNELGNGMKKLQLPRAISKEFFNELADADTCVCGRSIGEREKEEILKNAEGYLGSDAQAVLNLIKSSLVDSKYDERLNEAFEKLAELQKSANSLQNQYNINEANLMKAGGKKAEMLQRDIETLAGDIRVWQAEIGQIESRDDSDETLTVDNNIHRAEIKYREYETKITASTNTYDALKRKEIIEALVLKIRKQATDELKSDIIRKTNEKLAQVIPDDNIKIKNIDGYIQLEDRDGASEGQTLSIAYCFLSTLFEDAELEFPFIIDSPTGKMDLDKRKAVADIIPDVFNQMIAFVQSAEVEQFADQFYENRNTQYLTIIASEGDVKVHEGAQFFDTYQRQQKGDQK